MADIEIRGWVTWLKNWFYDKTEIASLLNAKVNLNQSQANKNVVTNASGEITVEDKPTIDSALSSTSENAVQNKAVKSALDRKADSSHNHSISQVTDLGATLENKLDSSLAESTFAPISHSHTSAQVTEPSALANLGTSANATQHAVNDAINTTIATKTVTVEKLATATTGYLASYIVKQNGVQVGNTIDIPKDYLLKSGSIQTVTTADTPVSGYVVGDKYLDLVINTKDSSGTDEHLYVLVSDLVDSSIAWSDITGKPSSFTPASHSHGEISSTGTILGSSLSSDSNYPLVRNTSDNKIKLGFLKTDYVKDPTAHSEISSSANATQSSINTAIDTAIGELWDSVDGKRNIQRTYTNNADNAVEEGHYYQLGGIVNSGQNQGMSFLDVMVDDYDRLIQVCYEYDYGEFFDNDVHQYIRYSTNNGSTWSSWKRFAEAKELVDWDYSSNGFTNGIKLVDKSTDATGKIIIHLKS